MSTSDDVITDPGIDPWAGIVGQPRAVAELRAAVTAPVHAYLLVGPSGAGKRALAAAFAAALLSDADESTEDRARHIQLALAERHPDLVVIEREGASIRADEARSVRDLAMRKPIESDRKVLVLDEFHLVTEVVGPILLKTIEEPPPGTFFVILADDIPPDLITIASRCVRIDLGSVPDDAIVEHLVATGVGPDAAVEAVAAAAGDLRRAELLASDPRLALRRQAWFDVPSRVDGRGHRVVTLVDELLAMIDDATEPLQAQHRAELAELEARVELYGERGSGRKALGDRHKRELRRQRTDELRFGLAILARRYRDAAVASERPGAYLDAVDAIGALNEELIRNPNDRLQLQALFFALPTLV
jgi:DNA polymerase III subunit delta'